MMLIHELSWLWKMLGIMVLACAAAVGVLVLVCKALGRRPGRLTVAAVIIAACVVAFLVINRLAQSPMPIGMDL